MNPSGLNLSANCGDSQQRADQNFTILNESNAFMRLPGKINGIATTLNGPPAIGEHLAGELWNDASGGQWLCVVAGTPGTWRQIGIPVFSSVPSGTFPAGYLSIRSDDNYTQKVWDGAAWVNVFLPWTLTTTFTRTLLDDTDASTARATLGAASQSDLNAHTGNTSNPHVVTKSQVGLGNVDDVQQLPYSATTAFSRNLLDDINAATARTTLDVPSTTDLSNHTSNTSNPHSVTKTQVGLSNVDNVQQLPYSSTTTFTRSLLDDTDAATARATLGVPASSDLSSHTGNTSNPHSVTKSQVGLGNVDNLQQLPYSSTTTFSRSLLDDTDASSARSTLGLGNAGGVSDSSVSTTQTPGSTYGTTEQTMLSNLKADVGNISSQLNDLLTKLRNLDLI